MSAGCTPLQIQAEAQRRKRERAAQPVERPPIWQPQAGPQQRAYVSRADVLGYGGEAGGGKSDLALGLAGTVHWRTLIFRREFPRLGGLIDRSREIFNADGRTAGDDSYNEALHRWKLRDGRQIQFAAIQYEQNKFNFQGRPHDLYVFDEATEFSETQIRFVIGWNRSTSQLPIHKSHTTMHALIALNGWPTVCRSLTSAQQMADAHNKSA
jgi:hypothetical protein